MPDEMNVVDQLNSKENSSEQVPTVNIEDLKMAIDSGQASLFKQTVDQTKECVHRESDVVQKLLQTEATVKVQKKSEILVETKEQYQPNEVVELAQQVPSSDKHLVQPLELNPVQQNQLKPVQPTIAEPTMRRNKSDRPSNSPKKADEVIAKSTGPPSSSAAAAAAAATSLSVSPPIVEQPVPFSQSATLMLKILEKKPSLKTPGEFEYLVQWNDLSTTWELHETISCGDMLANFEKELSSRPSRHSSSSKSSATKQKVGDKRKRQKSLNVSAEFQRSLNAFKETKTASVEVKPRSTRTSAAKAKLFIEEVTMASESICDSPRPIKRRRVDSDEKEEEEEYTEMDDYNEEEEDNEVPVRKSTSSGRYLPKTFIAQAILDERMQGPVRQFLIKWQGYDDPKENTWEPAANFMHFNLLVEDYEQNRRRDILKKAGPCSSISSSTTSISVNTKRNNSRGEARRKKSASGSVRKRLSSTPKKSTRATPIKNLPIKFTAPAALQKRADENLEEEEEEDEKVEAIVIQPPIAVTVPTTASAASHPKQPIWKTYKAPIDDSSAVKGKNPLIFTNSLEFGMQKGYKLSCILKVTKGPMEVGPKALVRYVDSMVQEWVPTAVVFKYYPQELVHFYEAKLKLYHNPVRTKKPLQERKNNITNINKSLEEEEESS